LQLLLQQQGWKMAQRLLLCWSQPTAKVGDISSRPSTVRMTLAVAAAAAAAAAAGLQGGQALAAVLESTYSQGGCWIR
jgi:hypothetical protein